MTKLGGENETLRMLRYEFSSCVILIGVPYGVRVHWSPCLSLAMTEGCRCAPDYRVEQNMNLGLPVHIIFLKKINEKCYLI